MKLKTTERSKIFRAKKIIFNEMKPNNRSRKTKPIPTAAATKIPGFASTLSRG